MHKPVDLYCLETFVVSSYSYTPLRKTNAKVKHLRKISVVFTIKTFCSQV